MRTCLFALLALALFSSCQKAPLEHSPRPAPITVRARLETITLEPWQVSSTFSASVEATRRTILSSQLVGTIRQVHAEVGAHVRQGQLLVTLSANQYALAEAQSQAAEREARAALPELESAIAGAQSQLKLALLNAQRMRDLFAKKSVTRQELDDSEARLEQAQSQLGLLQAKQAQAESRIAQAEQNVKSAQVFRGYTTVVAPFAGVIVEKHAEAGGLASPGAPLLTLEGEGGYRVVAAFPEGQGRTLAPGQTVKLDWQDGSSPSELKVSEVLPSVDPSTRSLPVRINVPPRPGIHSGSFVKLITTHPAEPSLSVPRQAVRSQGQLQMVFVLEDGIARSRMVSLGEEQSGRYRLLSGLAPNDRIVSPLTPDIADGVRIEVLP